MIAPPNTALTDEPGEGEISLTEGLQFVYQDCPWIDLETIKEQIWSPAFPVSRSRRFFLNQPNAADDAWCTLQEWSVLADTNRVLVDGEEVVLFFDGSKSNDHTALVGCCMSDGFVFTAGVWAPRKTRSDKGKNRGVLARRRFEQAIEQTYARASDARIRQAVARMTYLRSDLTELAHAGGELEVLELHKIDTIERLEALRHKVRWIPKSDEGVPTNDFQWMSRDDQKWELNSTKARYATIADRISRAVSSAAQHGLIKDNFLIDIGFSRLSPKLRSQLIRYNQRRSGQTIRELAVLSEGGEHLEMIKLA
ncbi:MAG: hypothetical protein Q4B10_01295 [Actinomycetaceae bacterium]|nr:hypothetical protein [Actinomycetaceae bacterium]